MGKKWFLLDESYQRTGKPLTVEQIQALLDSGKIDPETDVINEEGVGADVESVLGIENDYHYLSHKQRAYLTYLGYNGSLFITQADCSYAIQRLKTINPNGVNNLNYDKLVEQEEATGDTFFLKADNYVRRYGFSPLPKELRRPIKIKRSWVLLFAAFVFRSIRAVVLSIFSLIHFSTKKAIKFEKENKVLQKSASYIFATTKNLGTKIITSFSNNQEMPLRIWTSADGKSTVEAKLIGIAENVVRLQKTDGSVIDVLQNMLSQDDQMWLNGNVKINMSSR